MDYSWRTYRRNGDEIVWIPEPDGRPCIVSIGGREVRHGRYLYNSLKCRCGKCREAWTKSVRQRRRKRIRQETPAHLHGTPNGYVNWGCKCEDCKAAMALYQSGWRQGLTETPFSEVPHGTPTGYKNYKCRCYKCRFDASWRKAELRERGKE